MIALEPWCVKSLYAHDSAAHKKNHTKPARFKGVASEISLRMGIEDLSSFI